MRPYRSITGPLILIVIGLLFLVHTISPGLELLSLFGHYWPFLLIFWGLVQLVEIGIWAARGPRVPYRSVGSGGWVAVVVLCVLGLIAFQAQSGWWRHVGFHGVEFLGQDHDYSIAPQLRTTGAAPHVVIENFRGDAKVTAVDGTTLTVSGHKVVRALDPASANDADQKTPVDVIVQGKVVIVRCNQDRAGPRQSVTTDLDITVPRSASIEATGTRGDFDISGIKGDVDLSSENAGVRIENVDGSLRIDTRRSDEIRCANISGAVTLRGRGDDISLNKIAGDVNVDGTYVGTIELQDIANPVRVQNGRTQFDARRITGELTLARGSLDGRGISGPTKVTTHATDVTLADFNDELEVNTDRGDVELRPAIPLGRLTVRISSGNIDLKLPHSAGLVLTASTRHGTVDSNLGSSFHEEAQGGGASVQGAVGKGPEVTLSTNRGNITLRGESSADSESAEGADEHEVARTQE